MKPERWRKVEALFDAAVTRDADERAVFLAEACGGDSDLLREVESLLAHRADAEPFLETPPLGDVRRLLEQNVPGGLVGQLVGAYRIVEMVASGGMGTVYLAARADDQYQKQVALKVVRSGGRERELIERFRIERQTLACLEHANIARLIDGGITGDKRPYYVMEFVEGRPIDQYCEVGKDGGLSTRERLDLFCTVCEAVQYAHQNLVIHRDLKPSNILVTNDGTPKLLDFGLAKTLSAALAETDGPTVDGEFMGTVAYAAPEQVKGDVGNVDTRTDVYALGVILYRLLTDCSPYPAGGSLSDVIEHITEIAPTPPSAYGRQVDDELDAIVLKALSKDKGRRYQSAAALQEDIQRHLAGEPVLAKTESSWSWYLIRKTARRYRLPLAISAAFAVLVSTFAVMMTIQASRLARQRDIARRALRSSNIERGRALGLTDNMAPAEEVIWGEYLAAAGASESSAIDPTVQPAQDGGTLRLDHAYWALWELYSRHPCLLTTRDPNNQLISTITISPNGRLLASRGESGVTTLFDFPSGGYRGQLDSHIPRVAAMCFSPDSQLIALNSVDKTVKLWNLASSRCVATLKGHENEVENVSFSSDGRTLASSGGDGKIRLWDLASKTCTHVLVGHTDRVGQVSFSPDGRTLLSGASDGGVRLWDVSTGEPVAVLNDPSGKVYRVSFSPTGRLFATASGDITVRLWETASRRCVQVLTGHTAWVRAMDFHPRAPILATGSADKSVTLWDISSGRVIRRFAGHAREINALQFSPDGRLLASADWECIKFWDLTDHGSFRKLAELPGTVFSARFSPNARSVAFCRAHEDLTVRLCDRSTGATVHIFRGHTAPVSTIAFSPNGKTLASASYDHTVRLWDPATGSCKAILTGHQDGINSISFRHDGRELASGSDDGSIRIWEMPLGRHLATLEQGGLRIPSVCFSPDGQTLAASTGKEGAIVLWDMTTRRIHRRWKAHDVGVRPVCFSHDGRILASGGNDNQIKLWDLASGSCLATLQGHDQDIFCLGFARGDRILASGGRGNAIKLWDIAEQRCLVTLEGHNDMVFSVQFSPDGRELLSASRDGTVALWNLSYYDRHIAGNLAFQRTRLPGHPDGRIVAPRKTGRRSP